MEIRKGMAVSGGIAAGRLFYYRRKRQTADRSEPADVSLELLRFQNAREHAIKELQDLYEQAEKKAGADSAVLELKRYEALVSLSNSTAAKLIIPTDAVNAVTNNVMFTETTGLGDITKTAPKPVTKPPADPCCDDK